MEIKLSDGLLVGATILGPILAVQAQKAVERATETRRRRLQIFYTLMATRATRLAPDHVQALNRIDLEFSGKRFLGLINWQTTREKTIIERWREYFDRLCEQAPEEKTAEREVIQAWLKSWNERCDVAFIDLLHALSENFRFGFDKIQLRRGVYWPRAHGEAEIIQHTIQQSLAGILAGKTALNVNLVGLPFSRDAINHPLALQGAMPESASVKGVSTPVNVSSEQS